MLERVRCQWLENPPENCRFPALMASEMFPDLSCPAAVAAGSSRAGNRSVVAHVIAAYLLIILPLACGSAVEYGIKLLTARGDG